MASTIKTKSSTTPGAAPPSLAQGELAVNVAEFPPKLFVGGESGVLIIPSTAVNWTNSVRTASFTAVATSGYHVNGASVTVSLPANPADGVFLYLSDLEEDWDAFPVTLNGNGDFIAGAVSVALDKKGGNVIIIYVTSRAQWEYHYIGQSGEVERNAAAIETINTTIAEASYMPSGGIIMFSGLLANVPAGFFVCDGNNSTPNLIDRFIKASATTAGTTGGSATHTHANTLSAAGHTLTEAEMPSHRHSLTASTGNIQNGSDGSGERVGPPASSTNTNYTGGNSSHAHGINGSITAASTEPLFYSLIFIMKS
jgi:hypothetical protein